jgi:uncharacterized protein (TIGR03086 family)
VTYEALWVPDLLRGATIEAVGDRFEGDVLGDDPKGAWDRAATAELTAMQAVEPRRTVHLSGRDAPADEYAFERMLDLLIHGWDLMRGIGATGSLDAEAVDFCYPRLAPHEELLKQTGLFGRKVVPPPGADVETRLLALLGRVA